MKITYLYQPGRLARRKELDQREIPTEFFYGAPELEKKGYQIDYVEVHPVPAENKLRVLAELIVRPRFLPSKVYFAQLAGVKKVIPALLNSDVSVATTPGIAFSLAILNYLQGGCVRNPFLAIHCGVLNYSHNWVRTRLSRQLFKQMHTILYGEGELAAMQKTFCIPDDRITVNCFGVDDVFWSPDFSEIRSDYILSVGNDAQRDYDLLVQVARKLKKNVKILTKRDIKGNLPENIDIVNGSWHSQAITDPELRDLYRKAFCVVVPLKDSIQPSGQSVTLQAMACGTPVILSKTRGLWETEHLHDRLNVMFVCPENQNDIENAIFQLESNGQLHRTLCHEGRKYVEQYGMIGQFAKVMGERCECIVRERLAGI